MISKKSIRHAREILAPHSSRPLSVFLFTNPAYPNSSVEYKVSLTTTEIGIYVEDEPFMVNYVDKSTVDIASELNNSPYPITVKALVDLPFIKEGELLASGAVIPDGFQDIDRGDDGKSCIVRAYRWAVTYNRQSNISVQPPYPSGPVHPWYPRIQNGEFSSLVNSIIYYFSVPEYKNQPWSMRFGFPFADVEGEVANFIGAAKIKTSRAPILWKGNNIAITDNSGRTVFPSSIIKDVDTINGIVYIKEGANLPDNALIYYTYYEKTLVYRNLNLNGHFSQSPQMLDMYAVFYALPTSSTNGESRERGIYHAVGNSVPEAINNIDNVSMAEPLVVLGAIHVSTDISYEEANVIDTRSYGGGLNEDVDGIAAEKRFPQTQYFNDLSTYDGIPYHGSAAVVVELPDDITSVMTLEELRKATKKFVAAGVYTIIDFSSRRELYTPSNNFPDIAFSLYDTQKSDTPERTNYHSNTETYYDAFDGERLGIGSVWTYQTYRSTETTHGHPVEYRVYEDQERSDGLSGVWKFQVATGQSSPIFGYAAAAGHGFAYPWENSQASVWDNYGGGYIDRESVGYMSQHQTASYEVKEAYEGECPYMTVAIRDRGVELPKSVPRQLNWEANFRWVNGIPTFEYVAASPGDKTISVTEDEAFAYYIRDGWWRIGLTVSFPQAEWYEFNDLGRFSMSTGVGEGGLRVVFQRPMNTDGTMSASDYVGSGNLMGRSHFIPDTKSVAHKSWRNYQHIPGFFNQKLKETDPHYYSYYDLHGIRVQETGRAIGWINADLRLPRDIRTGSDSFLPYPSPNSLNSNINFEPGVSYYMKYLRGAANPTFYWEEQEEDGRWVKKRHIDRREVNEKTLAAGRIAVSSRAAKSIRNFSGVSLYPKQDINEFVDEVTPEIEQIYSDMALLNFNNGQYSFSTGLVVNISDGTTEEYDTAHQLTEDLYVPLLEGYSSVYSINYRSAYGSGAYIPDQRAVMFSDAVHHGTSDFPNAYNVSPPTFTLLLNDTGNYMKELYTYSTYAKDRINEAASIIGTGTPASVGDENIENIVSGMFSMAATMELLSSGGAGYDIGEDIRSPLYNAQQNVEIRLTGDYAEMNEELSNMYLSTEYVAAYAALYATQERPTKADYSHAVSMGATISPRDLAVSGIHSAIHHFERYYDYPRYNGEYKDINWLYTYNRHGNLAGRFVKNITSAIDNLYYGNTEWAGYKNTTKNAPWYTEAGLDAEFEGDLAFTRECFCLPAWTGSIPLSGHFPVMLEGFKVITDKIKPLLEANMLRGGITTPEMIDLVRGYLWIPYNAALGEDIFITEFDQDDVLTFERCMSSILKGSTTEDGYLFESTQFKQDPVGQPSFPVEIMKASVDAVKYYRATNDSYNEARWIATLQGLWHTATGLYKGSYGYPTTINFDGTGDSGTKLLEAALPILSLRTAPYTSGELQLLTGYSTSRL